MSQRGYAGTTTNHVAAAAGVSIGSLYEYFPNKDALVVALAEEHFRGGEERLLHRLRHATRLIKSLPLEDVVEGFVMAMVDLHAADPRLHRVLFEEAGHLLPVRLHKTRLTDEMVRAVAGVLARYADQKDRARASARVVVDLVDTLSHRWMVDAEGNPLAPRVLHREIVRVVLGYLRYPG